jgi:hypothetical protein
MMAKHLRVDFTITGFLDGPVAQKLLDEGKTPEWFAQYIAHELKILVTEEVANSEPQYTHKVSVHATAKLHEADDNVGEASTE